MARRKKHAGGRPPLPEGERLSTQVGVRLESESTARLDEIVRRTRRLVPRSAICRVAMARGLATVEDDLRVLFDNERMADLVLSKCWDAQGLLGGAEIDHPKAECVVWLDNLTTEGRS